MSALKVADVYQMHSNGKSCQREERTQLDSPRDVDGKHLLYVTGAGLPYTMGAPIRSDPETSELALPPRLSTYYINSTP